jgi:hypothetical protein
LFETAGSTEVNAPAKATRRIRLGVEECAPGTATSAATARTIIRRDPTRMFYNGASRRGNSGWGRDACSILGSLCSPGRRLRQPLRWPSRRTTALAKTGSRGALRAPKLGRERLLVRQRSHPAQIPQESAGRPQRLRAIPASQRTKSLLWPPIPASPGSAGNPRYRFASRRSPVRSRHAPSRKGPLTP